MRFRRAAAVTVGAFAAAMLATSARIRRAGRPTPLEQADAILVFGAAVWRTGPSLTVKVRVARAAQVFADGWAPVVVCSAGWSDGLSEATVMRQMLADSGVPTEAIIPDNEGTTTREAIRSARRLGAGRWRSVIAVSSPYHLRRIRSEARRQGLTVIPCPALRPGPPTRGLLAFDLRHHFRELLAVPSYAVTAHLGSIRAGRLSTAIRAALVVPAARARSFLGEMDAVADTSDLIAERIREAGNQVSESDAAMTPGAAALSWPATGRVTGSFGLRHRRLHTGIDIAAVHENPVFASGAGTVLLAERLGPFGNVVVIDHGGGLSTVYAHLVGPMVREMETVDSRQTIGLVGATGRSFGPHLHFEVRVHGTPVDPHSYLP